MPEGYTKENQTCCLFLKLETGMKVLGYVAMVSAVLDLIQLIMVFATSPLSGLFTTLIFIVPFYVMFLWFKWLRNDVEETTRKVVLGMKVLFGYTVFLGIVLITLMVCGVFYFSVLLYAAQKGEEDELHKKAVPLILSFTGAYIVQCYFNWYFYRVTKRYYDSRHKQFDD